MKEKLYKIYRAHNQNYLKLLLLAPLLLILLPVSFAVPNGLTVYHNANSVIGGVFPENYTINGTLNITPSTTSGTDFFINNSGFVGIGTISTGPRLEVANTNNHSEIVINALSDSYNSSLYLLEQYDTQARQGLFVEYSSLDGYIGTCVTGTCTRVVKFERTSPVEETLVIDAGRLYALGGGDASLSANGYLVLGATTGTNVVIDNNEIMARNNGAVTGFFVQGDGGDFNVGGGTASVRMVVKDSGNVGIGTTAPDNLLEIDVGNVNAEVTALKLTNSGTTAGDDVAIEFHAADGVLPGSFAKIVGHAPGASDNELSFHTSDAGTESEQMRIDDQGNVGIGTSDPNQKLVVVGDANVTGILYVGSQSFTNIDASGNLAAGDNTSTHVFQGNSTFDTEDNVLHVDSTNNRIGIGTASPGTALEIDTNSNTFGLRMRGTDESNEIADIYVSAGGELILTTRYTGGSTGFIEVNGEDDNWGLIIRDSDTGNSAYANLYMNDADVDYLNIVVQDTNSATGLVIDDDNQVGIGTTTPNQELVVVGDANVTGILYVGSQSFTNIDASGNLAAGDNTSTHVFQGNSTFDTEDNVLHVDSTNNYVGIGTGTPVSTLHVGGTTDFGISLHGTTSNADSWIEFYEGSAVAMKIEYEGLGNTLDFWDMTGTPTERVTFSRGGNVGIGDNGPDYPLEILSTTTPQFAISNDDGNDYATFDVSTAGLLTITTVDQAAALGHIALMPDGNVGIGTVGPSEILEVAGSDHRIKVSDSGDSYNSRAEMGDSSGNGGYFKLYDDSEATTALIRSYAVSNVQGYFTAGNIGINTTVPGGLLHINTSGTDFIVDGGKVGIGTTAPQAPIHLTSSSITNNVAGIFATAGSTSPRYKFVTNGEATGNTVRILADTDSSNVLSSNTGLGEIVFEATDSDPNPLKADILFRTNYGDAVTTAMIIDDSGRVGINTTEPGGLLHVNTSGTDFFVGGGNVGIGTTAPSGLQIESLTTNTAQSTDNIRLGVISGTPRAIFEDSGNSIWQIDNSAGNLRFIVPSTLHAQLTTDAFEINTIRDVSGGNLILQDDSGNVGIGTVAPIEKLEVNGTQVITNQTTGSQGRIYHNGTHLILEG